MFEHMTLDGRNFRWDAMAQADNRGKVYNNLVIAGVSLVNEFEVW
jgi:hypothetical protein